MSKYNKPEDVDNHWLLPEREMVLTERDNDDFVREADFDDTYDEDEVGPLEKSTTPREDIINRIDRLSFEDSMGRETTQKLMFELNKLLNSHKER